MAGSQNDRYFYGGDTIFVKKLMDYFRDEFSFKCFTRLKYMRCLEYRLRPVEYESNKTLYRSLRYARVERLQSGRLKTLKEPCHQPGLSSLEWSFLMKSELRYSRCDRDEKNTVITRIIIAAFPPFLLSPVFFAAQLKGRCVSLRERPPIASLSKETRLETCH